MKEIDKFYKDENAFVLSLNNNKIYKVLKQEFAIRFVNEINPILIGNNSYSNGFYFNDSGKEIYDGGLLNNPKVYDFEKNYELTEKSNKFNELEIFEINGYI